MVKLMKKYNIILSIFFFLFLIYSLLNIKEINASTMNILKTFSKTILPALLPFLILNQLILKLGIIDLLGYILQFISYPLFKISGKGASIIIIGLLNGFPSSAIFTSLLLQDKQIKKEEAQRLINYIFFPSISFLFAIIKTDLNNNYLFTILSLSLYLGGFISLYISSFKIKNDQEYISFTKTKEEIKNKLSTFKFARNIKDIINYAFSTLISILGIIVIFSIPCNIIGKMINNNFTYLFKGIIEFSIPTISLLNSSLTKKRIVSFLATILSFSGLSSIMQASLFIEEANLSTKQFLINRTLISLLTITILYTFLSFPQ